MKIQVVKIGGSLLMRPSLLVDLHRWIERTSHETSLTLAIIGGGEMIEAVRNWDRIRPGQAAAVHWRCVEMLRFSLESFWEVVSSDRSWRGDVASGAVSVVWSPEAFEEWLHQKLPAMAMSGDSTSRLVFVSVPSFYFPDGLHASQERSAMGVELPTDWRTTTDSIAMKLAEIVHREGLVGGDAGVSDQAKTRQKPDARRFTVGCTVLKSCAVPAGSTVESLVEAGVIDQACGLFRRRAFSFRAERLESSDDDLAD